MIALGEADEAYDLHIGVLLILLLDSTLRAIHSRDLFVHRHHLLDGGADGLVECLAQDRPPHGARSRAQNEHTEAYLGQPYSHLVPLPVRQLEVMAKQVQAVGILDYVAAWLPETERTIATQECRAQEVPPGVIKVTDAEGVLADSLEGLIDESRVILGARITDSGVEGTPKPLVIVSLDIDVNDGLGGGDHRLQCDSSAILPVVGRRHEAAGLLDENLIRLECLLFRRSEM